LAGAPVEDQRDAAAERLKDVPSEGGGGGPGEVCAGGGQREAAGLDDRLEQRMSGPADGDGRGAGSDDLGDNGGLG